MNSCFAERLQAQTEQLDVLLSTASSSYPQLKQREAELRSAQARIAEARHAFRPVVSVGGTYTLAAGGRTIGLPLGDLLNPAYSTLNQLTQTQAFPQLENQEEPLLPNNFYDARLRVQQAIIDPSLKLNRERAKLGSSAAEAAMAVTEADVRLAVRTAYFQLGQAQQAIKILEASDALLGEAYRTTSSLVRNGAALPIARERISAERAQLTAQLATASLRSASAKAQLKFLTGLDTLVLQGQDDWPQAGASATAAPHPELAQIEAAIQLVGVDAKLERQFRRPRVSAQVDLGSQDFDFGLQPYVLAGLAVNVPLYDGGRHRDRTQRIAADQDAAVAQKEQITRSLALREQVARNQLEAAQARLAAFDPAIAAAERTLQDAQILYANDSANYLQLLDARTQFTSTQLQRNLARYDIYISYSELLRALGQ